MESLIKLFSFVAVHIKRVHIKLAGFVLMLVLMVFLNNRIEQSDQNRKHQTESVVSMEVNNHGIAPLSAKVPHAPEGSLPIKLITNLNSNFLYFVNTGFEFRNEFNYLMLRKRYVRYVHKIQQRKLLTYLISSKNKDIR